MIIIRKGESFKTLEEAQEWSKGKKNIKYTEGYPKGYIGVSYEVEQ